ncbi:MAG: prepilin-type N-terminal cleavage/methylation domain-containing protein, partial [Acidimicrobiales bacterium]|nr:prepilin-type N-terminal cleavage/methylation domain-containing protein [Acidimicrobiales bacterium]
MAHPRHRGGSRDDRGLTLMEMMVAFTTLLILFTITGLVLNTYLNAGTTVISTYNSAGEFIPSQIIISRLLRSQVEPAPTPTSGSTSCSSAANVPCPPFLTGSVGTYSVTFYANVGGTQGQYGPAKIVMAEGTPTKCGNCNFYSAPFTVMEYPALQTPACPTSPTATTSCTWSTTGTQLVDIQNVVNGAATVASPVTACGQSTTTPLCQSSTPIFTYNTIDPYSTAYTPNNTGGTPPASGVLPAFNTCNAPTYSGQTPTQSNCPPDMIQSVGVDLMVQTPGSPLQ